MKILSKYDAGGPEYRAKIGSLSGTVGIISNLLLFGGKLVVGALSGSVSVTADAMNNLSDASSAIVTFLGFRLAGKPADEHHPYGHARYEYLTGLAVAVMILFIGFELAKSSVIKIIQPTAVDFSLPVVLVLVISIAVKLGLYLFNRKLGRLIDSSALMATAADSRNDCIATFAVLLAGLIQTVTELSLDGLMGLGVALFILLSGWNLARDTISPLLGERTSPEIQQRIVDYIAANPQVLGYHDLMVHDYGPGQRYASVHVEMDHRMDPMTCHEIIDDLERECLQSHGIHLVIHHDPVVTDDPELTRLRQVVQEILTGMDPRLGIHDFRLIFRGGRILLIFDVAMPMDLWDRQKEIAQELNEALSSREQVRYDTVITFDPISFNP